MADSIVKIPDIGEGVAEVEVVEWLVKPGDRVREDDILAGVMTDKATVEIPSPFAGTIVSLGSEVGQMLAVGATLVTIARDEAVVAGDIADGTQLDAAGKTSDETAPAGVALAPANPSAVEELPLRASPAVRARARAAGIDLRNVSGTGPGGLILDADIDAAIARHAATVSIPQHARRDGTQPVPIIGLRRKIAERMASASSRIPHITIVEEVDVTAVEEMRTAMNDARGERPKLTVLPFLTAALCQVLVDYPDLNAHFEDDAGVLVRHNPVHIGIATMTEAGLVVPVLRHAESLQPFDTAAEIARLAEAARSGSATRDELSGSTITVSSLGPLGAIATTPILNAPEVAILGVNKMAIRPMWDGTDFVPRKMMNISGSFDHRVIDGWVAASFIHDLKRLLESPAMIPMLKV